MAKPFFLKKLIIGPPIVPVIYLSNATRRPDCAPNPLSAASMASAKGVLAAVTNPDT